MKGNSASHKPDRLRLRYEEPGEARHVPVEPFRSIDILRGRVYSRNNETIHPIKEEGEYYVWHLS